MCSMTHDDVTERWLEHLASGGSDRLPSGWALLRDAESTFARMGTLVEILGWIRPDDKPTAYLVRVTRRSAGGRAARYDIIGVARLDHSSEAREMIVPIPAKASSSARTSAGLRSAR